MFPTQFPSLVSTDRASILLAFSAFRRSEGVEGNSGQPSPPVVGSRTPRKAASLQCSLAMPPSGEQPGEHAVRVHSYEPRHARLGDGIDRPGGKGRTSVASCVRRFCLECVGASSGRAAFDCGSRVCPLRPASPFLGKPLPLTMRADDYSGEPARAAKRRPSRIIIHAQCRQCQPGDRTDCMAEDCALYPFRPWSGPGHAAKRQASPKQLETAVRALEIARQKGSWASGAALDA